MVVFAWPGFLVSKRQTTFLKKILNLHTCDEIAYSAIIHPYVFLCVPLLFFIFWSFAFFYEFSERSALEIVVVLMVSNILKNNKEEKNEDKWEHLKNVLEFLL